MAGKAARPPMTGAGHMRSCVVSFPLCSPPKSVTDIAINNEEQRTLNRQREGGGEGRLTPRDRSGGADD